ncbi:EAL domain-containing protein [Eisenbergiella tayi]|uniref:Phytochrome-like protein cph2 n=1 Tax=Eisenbergiella tayi TaxID=1432052 RepID=A0A1E3A7U0_9FIRM|nr:EAL domain-containing protein [Eisenbergiella tayi]ODM04286.1 Phytochrome-like protein cph2 [Eisenbergiella tayi]
MIREDKRIKENNILRAEPGFVIAVLAVLILLIAAVTIQSALGLKTAVDRTTKAYVSDVAAQSALDIDDRLSLYQENNIIGVLEGTGNKESMQRLIQPVSFDGQGLTCIADTEGNVVISPTDLDPFMRLDDIFKEDSEETTVRNIKRMQENMKEGKNGVFSFVAVDGRELILSYNILKSYDWVLLTLVPADLISYETDRYVIQTFAIVAGTILLFLFFLLILLFIYRNNRRRLEYIAFVDAVTGGMNNAAFCLKLRETLKNARRNEYTVAVINIRNFKMINESFGTHEGDRTLHYCMQILRKNVKEGEIAARGNADDFFLCLKEGNRNIVAARLQEIVREINSFNENLENPYHLSFRQGAYLIDEPDLDSTIIQDRVMTACMNQQEFGENSCVFYDICFTQKMKQEHELNDMFRGALENGDFKVYFQPKVSLEDEKTAGAEALVRWQHPEEGMISPGDFIPLFEKNGNICRLDCYVFEEVCRTIDRWRREGRKLFPISVNLSRQHFKRNDFLNQFADVAAKYRIPEGLLELELTESIFFDDNSIAMVRESINRMHELGFKCSLDDFGSGFSSLGLLKEFDVDTIKLDRRFFLEMSKPKAEDVVECLIDLAGRLKVKTVAEGIETQEQIDFLKQIHCDMVQGFFYSRPLRVEEFEEWADRRG